MHGAGTTSPTCPCGYGHPLATLHARLLSGGPWTKIIAFNSALHALSISRSHLESSRSASPSPQLTLPGYSKALTVLSVTKNWRILTFLTGHRPSFKDWGLVFAGDSQPHPVISVRESNQQVIPVLLRGFRSVVQVPQKCLRTLVKPIRQDRKSTRLELQSR